MMIAEMDEHKRRNHDGFLLANLPVDGGGCSSSKRLKTSTIPYKEKKDKVGEGVASLQQLVSPFGKTDTASVLEEATAYIRFLHDQLQVLSAPYIRNTAPGMVQDPDTYYSLRRRGLCVMPVSMTLGIAQSNGADLWAPANAGKHP